MTDERTYFTGRHPDGSPLIQNHAQRDFEAREADAWLDAMERKPLFTWLGLSLVRRSEKTPYFHLPGYMRRFWLWRSKLVSVRIHHILRSDNDRHLHCHPWWNISIVLRGGYFEWMPNPKAVTPQGIIRKWRGPGSIVLRKSSSRHRLDLPAGTTTWSIFIHGRKSREWGFYTEEGFVHWREYVGVSDEEKAT